MIRLYLGRHGDAESPHVDPRRPLSAKGQQQVTQLAALLSTRHIQIQDVYHSGILRAQQTADVLGPAVGAQKVAVLQGLQPNDPVDGVGHMAAGLVEPTLLVGHLPFMGRMAAWLVLGHTQREVVIFDTATLACLLYVGGGHWAIEWVLNTALFAH